MNVRPIIISTLAAIGIASAGAALAQSEPAAVKPEYVFSMEKALVSRCADDLRFNIAFSNAAMQDRDDIAIRDIVRTIRSCELEYSVPKKTGMVHVGLEALGEVGCAEPQCTDEARRHVAMSSWHIARRFIEEYAVVLLIELKDTCSTTHEYDCVPQAVERANATTGARGYPWLETDDRGRAVKVGSASYVPEESAPTAQSVEVASEIDDVVAIHDAIEATFPDGVTDGASDIAEQVASSLPHTVSISEDGEIMFSGGANAWSVDVVSDMWRVRTRVGEAPCRAFAQDFSAAEATEVTINSRLARNADAANLCEPDSNLVAFAY